MKTFTKKTPECAANNVGKSILLLLLFIPFLFSACDDQRVQTIKWTELEPVYMTPDEFKKSVAMETSRALEKPGKIYFYNNYLFVNEINKGVHIVDNSNPAAPSNIGFINIPANKDIAVKGDLLYADSHSDFLVFNIENMQNPELINRIENVFESSVSIQRGFPYQEVDASQGIVVDWKEVEIEEVCEDDCSFNQPTRGWGWETAISTSGSPSMQSDGVATTGGTGGSMARFAIKGDYLYAVDHRNLLTFDISSPTPTEGNKRDVGWAIETIFPYQQNLFIGSESAMYIYDISDPAFPTQISVYNHFTACDPVVVEGNFAYVTLREGARCPQQGVNRLEVIDVEDPVYPKEVASYEMLNPHGLGIDGDYLFISEGEKGLKILDATDPYEITQLRHIEDIRTFDVIPFNNVLMITGETGIVQYDYSDINNVEHLSTIPVKE
ncbi:MAG: hypothetical protein WD059_04300 [Balneolaceae bacterium]